MAIKTMNEIQKLISQMTIDEKIAYVMGKGFWNTMAIDRLGIPTMEVADGPYGLRKQVGVSDHMGWNESLKATSFPCGSSIGSTWNRGLIHEMGEALGEECQVQDVQILLGPAINIKRQPLNGRNFEYYSEDPYITAEIGKAYVNGVQSKGIGTCVKHFAANNQEHFRNMVDTLIDERTLHEVYLYAFEDIIKSSKPWTIMSAYNKLNGKYCSQSQELLTNILREKWGFDGFVMSDWMGTYDSLFAHKAGLDLEMPCGFEKSANRLREALNGGELTEDELDKAISIILKIVFQSSEEKENHTKKEINIEKHHQLAKKVALEGAVLLKNEEQILPLSKSEHIAVIGELAELSGSQVGGSATVNSIKMDIPIDELRRAADEMSLVTYARGYCITDVEKSEELLKDAVQTAAQADKAVVFVGLQKDGEAEGFDRKHMRIDDQHIKLIEACAEVQPNVIVILCCGSAVEMPWIPKVKAVLNMHLGGQAMGSAVSELLYGIENPSGKLTETFPECIENNPAFLAYPDYNRQVSYTEEVFVGYRYYDTKKIKTLFQFGFGLSYTEFEYSNLSVSKEKATDEEEIQIQFTVTNIGKLPGKEIPQLYIHDARSTIRKPYKELKGFEKIHLNPGESKKVTIVLNKKYFAYYNVDIHDWYVEGGIYEILIGSSSSDIKLRKSIEIWPVKPLKASYTLDSTIEEILNEESREKDGEKIIRELLGDMPEFLKNGTFRNMLNFPMCRCTEDEMQKAIDIINQI